MGSVVTGLAVKDPTTPETDIVKEVLGVEVMPIW
jgi:hypothetical protein